MSLTSIDLYETDGLLLFRSKSAIFQTADLERVKEKAENIFNFYLDFNWEFEFVGRNKLRQCRSFIDISWRMRKMRSTNRNLYGQAETFYCIVDSLYRFGDSVRNSLCQCQHRQ